MGALARTGSEQKLPAGCEVALGNALDASTFAAQVAPADTFVQLVGVAHPGPSKAAQFESIDFVSARESVRASVDARIAHFVYLSVAHPVNVMRAYQDAGPPLAEPRALDVPAIRRAKPSTD